ncbi:unnamed protein product [Sphagnum balticum]
MEGEMIATPHRAGALVDSQVDIDIDPIFADLHRMYKRRNEEDTREEISHEADYGETAESSRCVPPTHPKEPINESLKRIRNLMYIRAGNNELRVALEDWESSEKAYRERVHRNKKVDLNCITVSQTFTSRLQRLKQEGRDFSFRSSNDYIIESTKFGRSLFGFSFTATTWVALAIGIFGALCLVAIDRLLCHSS